MPCSPCLSNNGALYRGTVPNILASVLCFFSVCICFCVCACPPGKRKRFVRLSEWLVVAGEGRTRLLSSGTQYLKGKTGRGRAAQVRK